MDIIAPALSAPPLRDCIDWDDLKSPEDIACTYESMMRKILHVETDALPRFDLVLGLKETATPLRCFRGIRL
jgi:hypothetical protein